jgi:ketosteroid isomerase-like protein
MSARRDDYDAIVRVMRLYIDAFNDNDVAKLKEAFDEDAWIFYIGSDGALHKHRISEDFARWAAPPSWDVVARFISVSQVGDAAAVQLSFDSAKSGGGWIDFHHLVRVKGTWKITNKTATHCSR